LSDEKDGDSTFEHSILIKENPLGANGKQPNDFKKTEEQSCEGEEDKSTFF
jgi:hypothetical protein